MKYLDNVDEMHSRLLIGLGLHGCCCCDCLIAKMTWKRLKINRRYSFLELTIKNIVIRRSTVCSASMEVCSLWKSVHKTNLSTFYAMTHKYTGRSVGVGLAMHESPVFSCHDDLNAMRSYQDRASTTTDCRSLQDAARRTRDWIYRANLICDRRLLPLALSNH